MRELSAAERTVSAEDVETYVAEIRRALGESSCRPVWIKALREYGYALRLPVKARAQGSAATSDFRGIPDPETPNPKLILVVLAASAAVGLLGMIALLRWAA